jgi:hypothetical protein
MPKNEYVQIDDEQTVFDAMNRMKDLGIEASNSGAKFNSLLGQKKELYHLVKVLSKELIHDLHDLGNFMKPADSPSRKSVIKRSAPTKKIVRKATPKRPIRKSNSSMKKLKANMKKAKSKK